MALFFKLTRRFAFGSDYVEIEWILEDELMDEGIRAQSEKLGEMGKNSCFAFY
jgi:hypothetical protein